MGLSKYWVLILLVLALVAVLWLFGRRVFTGITKWFLRALGALCACAGLIALVSSEGKPLPILGEFLLWVFAAYVVKLAESPLYQGPSPLMTCGAFAFGFRTRVFRSGRRSGSQSARTAGYQFLKTGIATPFDLIA